MLKKTYDKVCELFEEGNGYLPTRTLLNNKITTIQIRTMLQEGKIEKVSHGNYWNLMSGRKKPKHYKMLEACMTNKKAVICSLRDRKSTRLNSSHIEESRMPSSA